MSSALQVGTGGPTMPDFRKGTEIQDRYVLSEHVATGGFGAVWRATDKKLNRDVAIKRLLRSSLASPQVEDVEAVLAEARSASTLKGHKNIVEVFDVVEDGGEALIIMEFVDGPSLETVFRDHVLRGTWVATDDALYYFRQLLEGLLYSHSCGLIHRDVKPSNVLVSKLGVVKIADFGIAKPISFSRAAPPAAGAGDLAGTGSEQFMSHEQSRGEDLDQRTDIFSAGILGYLLVSGRHPFNHPSGAFTIFELIRDPSYAAAEIAARPDLPESVRKAIMKMLAKDRGQRYPSIIQPLGELSRGSSQPCPQCASPSPIGNNFCGQCGAPLQRSEQTAEAPAETAEALTDAGFALATDGDWEKAADYYRRAIAKNSSYGRAYSNLGYSLNRLGKYEDAVAILSKGIQVTSEPNILHRLYDAKGFAESNLKRYDDAIRDFTDAIRLNPRNPRVLCHRAESRAQTGELELAYQDVEAALHLDPDYTPAARLRSLLARGRYGI